MENANQKPMNDIIRTSVYLKRDLRQSFSILMSARRQSLSNFVSNAMAAELASPSAKQELVAALSVSQE